MIILILTTPTSYSFYLENDFDKETIELARNIAEKHKDLNRITMADREGYTQTELGLSVENSLSHLGMGIQDQVVFVNIRSNFIDLVDLYKEKFRNFVEPSQKEIDNIINRDYFIVEAAIITPNRNLIGNKNKFEVYLSVPADTKENSTVSYVNMKKIEPYEVTEKNLNLNDYNQWLGSIQAQFLYKDIEHLLNMDKDKDVRTEIYFETGEEEFIFGILESELNFHQLK